MITPLDFYWLYRDLDVPLWDGTRVGGLDVHEYRNAGTYFKPRDPDNPPNRDDDHGVFHGMDAGWHRLTPRKKKHPDREGGRGGRAAQWPPPEPPPGKRGAAPPPPVIGPTPYTEEVEDWRDLLRVFDGKGSPKHIQQALRLAH